MNFINFRLKTDATVRLGLETFGGIVDLTAASGTGEIALGPGMSIPEVIQTADGIQGIAKSIEALSAETTKQNLLSRDQVQYLAPVPRPQKIFGIGLNYHDHAEETGMTKPSEPLLFAMFANTVVGPEDSIVIPPVSNKIDYEAELAVVIGRRARNVPIGKALDFVAGYTIVNDVSARDLQLNDNQWIRGKSFDTALPMGPVLVPTSDLGDAGNLDISLKLNGTTMQDSNTRHLIFDVPQLVSYISEAFTLEPGDIIATGTPGGVGFARKPPVYLKDGDVVEIEIEGIGILRNPVRNE